MSSQIVLVTGGAGFLGQHLVRALQQCDEVAEIRVLDLVEYTNKLGHVENTRVNSFVGDVREMSSEFSSRVFQGVNTVFHAAAHVSHEFPPDEPTLFAINVQVEEVWKADELQDDLEPFIIRLGGHCFAQYSNMNCITWTNNVISLCLQHQVANLIYTSSAEVCVRPYFQKGFFCLSINETESKAVPPTSKEEMVFGFYAESKLKGEELVLAANGNGLLKTTSLRPITMYGEEDNGIVLNTIKIAVATGSFWRVGGNGGKHQFVYAGNVAWAHIGAMRALNSKNSSAISGLPVFITDDTPINDCLRFCEKLCDTLVARSLWFVPTFVSFVIFHVFEILFGLARLVGAQRLPISPKSWAIYLGSVVLFSRLRANIHLGYRPQYSAADAFQKSKEYYTNKMKEIKGKNL